MEENFTITKMFNNQNQNDQINNENELNETKKTGCKFGLMCTMCLNPDFKSLELKLGIWWAWSTQPGAWTSLCLWNILLTTRNVNVSTVEDITKLEYLPNTPQYWINSFWYLQRNLWDFSMILNMKGWGAMGIVVFGGSKNIDRIFFSSGSQEDM